MFLIRLAFAIPDTCVVSQLWHCWIYDTEPVADSPDYTVLFKNEKCGDDPFLPLIGLHEY